MQFVVGWLHGWGTVDARGPTMGLKHLWILVPATKPQDTEDNCIPSAFRFPVQWLQLPLWGLVHREGNQSSSYTIPFPIHFQSTWSKVCILWDSQCGCCCSATKACKNVRKWTNLVTVSVLALICNTHSLDSLVSNVTTPVFQMSFLPFQVFLQIFLSTH